PRLVQVYKATGVPSLDGRLSYLLNIQKEQPSGENMTSQASINTASSIKKSNIGRLNILDKFVDLQWIKNFLQSISSGSYEIYLIFGAIGLLVIAIRHSFVIEMIAPLAIVLYSLPLLFVTAVSQRYFSGNVLLLMPFTLTGFIFIYELTKKYKIEKISIVIFCFILLLQIRNGLDQAFSRGDAYYRLTGQWIYAHKSNFAINHAPFRLVSDMPQFCYWAETEGINLGCLSGDDIAIPSKDDIEKFHISAIIVSNRNKKVLKILKECYYLKGIEHPNQAKASIFVLLK
ncbi:MAG: hypothetical protein WC071_08930, partial [Victivallaceae bacterium]